VYRRGREREGEGEGGRGRGREGRKGEGGRERKGAGLLLRLRSGFLPFLSFDRGTKSKEMRTCKAVIDAGYSFFLY
jgi:hypothetical protein